MKSIAMWLINKLGGSHLSGFKTKAGIAATRVIAANAILILLAQSLILVSEGKYAEAAWNLNDEQMWIALAALGIVQTQGGAAFKTDKDTAVTLAVAKNQPVLAQEIAEGKAPPSAASAIPPAP